MGGGVPPPWHVVIGLLDPRKPKAIAIDEAFGWSTDIELTRVKRGIRCVVSVRAMNAADARKRVSSIVAGLRIAVVWRRRDRPTRAQLRAMHLLWFHDAD